MSRAALLVAAHVSWPSVWIGLVFVRASHGRTGRRLGPSTTASPIVRLLRRFAACLLDRPGKMPMVVLLCGLTLLLVEHDLRQLVRHAADFFRCLPHQSGSVDHLLRPQEDKGHQGDHQDFERAHPQNSSRDRHLADDAGRTLTWASLRRVPFRLQHHVHSNFIHQPLDLAQGESHDIQVASGKPRHGGESNVLYGIPARPCRTARRTRCTPPSPRRSILASPHRCW